jgi:hypothetical protein
MNDHLADYTDEERRAFETLPRSAKVDPALEDRVVRALRSEGLLRPRTTPLARAAMLAAAAALVAAAWFGGAWYGANAARAGSIEEQVRRSDLSSAERILLMQRAGSAYVAAANNYAASVKRADSTAVEVSSQVLLSAAQAVARANLDGILAPRLASAIAGAQRATPTTHSVIWY